MAFLHHSQPRITTPPRASTTSPLHLGPHHTSCRSAARGCFWQTPPMLPRMLRGRNCRIATCIGRPFTCGKPAVGRPRGFACAATLPSMNTTRCCRTCQHRRCAPRTAPAGSHLTYANPVADGCVAADPPQKSFPALASAFHPPRRLMLQHTLLPQHHPRSRHRSAPAHGCTHSWLFVPLLHAAVGRLHPAALTAWEAHALCAPLWQRGLATLLRHVEPAALVHALHTCCMFLWGSERHLRCCVTLLDFLATARPPLPMPPPPQPHVGSQTAFDGHPRAAHAEPHPGPPNESPSSSTSDSARAARRTWGRFRQVRGSASRRGRARRGRSSSREATELSASARALISEPLAPGSSDKLSVTLRTGPKLLIRPGNSVRSRCIRSSHVCGPPYEDRPLDPQASPTSTCAYCTTKLTALSCAAERLAR